MPGRVLSRRPVRVLLVTGMALVLIACGRVAMRLNTSVELARASEPFQHAPDRARLRLLIVGDSTAVGTGASDASLSLAGLLADAYPLLAIENRARDGATFDEIVAQLDGAGQVDAVLVQAGGNDVIRLRSLAALRADVTRVADAARRRTNWVVLMPAGNVGNAPLFAPPVSWLMTARARRLHAIVREVATREGVTYVNLFHEARDDPFALFPELNAADGLHPSNAGYRVWFDALVTQAGLAKRFAAARVE
jgi:lysophospholipase L1-like esterase